MTEYIEKQAVLDELDEDIEEFVECDYALKFAKRYIKKIPPANVRPVAEIDEAVDEAIRILNAINSRGNMDYADYCEMHDVISAINPNCGADMREQEEKPKDPFEGWSEELKETYRKLLASLHLEGGDAE